MPCERALKTEEIWKRPRQNLDGLLKEIRKKCLTNLKAHGKLNKFASEDVNELEKF